MVRRARGEHMQLALVGVGQAGGKIVDAFLEYDDQRGSDVVTSATAINTAESDLRGLERVPKEHRVLIGQSRVKGHGVGADNRLAAEIAGKESNRILGALDHVPAGRTDAFLVIGSLGGGTGSGAAPVIARNLRRVYTEPVYGLGVLPGRGEGGIYSLNAAQSFRTFVDEVDNLLLFDNDAWRDTGEALSASYDRINDEIARRFGVLFTAGAVDDGDVVGESIVDASEIINTLSTGGVSTVGYAAETIEADEKGGLLSRFRGEETVDTATATNRITSAVRQATLGRLTLPCSVDSADRALVVVGGPPEQLNRQGIERAREWVAEEAGTMEVRGGDYPLPGSEHVAGAVLLSNVTDVPRIEELQQVAVETQDTIEATRSESERDREKLVTDDGDEIDPLI